jgi:hypothetical protein
LEKTAVQFLDPRGVLVELRLNDLVEAAIDGREAFVHLFAEAADLNMHLTDLIAHVGADVLAFFFDETRKLLELGLFVLQHASQYTILGSSTKAMDSEVIALKGITFALATFRIMEECGERTSKRGHEHAYAFKVQRNSRLRSYH